MAFTIAGVLSVLIMIFVQFFVVPQQRKKIVDKFPYSEGIFVYHDANENVERLSREEEARVNLLFHFIQILAAIFSSFAHGGNDVATAIGPLITIWLVYTEGAVKSTSETPIFILAFGSVGIVFGLWILGQGVIETVGFNLTKIKPAT